MQPTYCPKCVPPRLGYWKGSESPSFNAKKHNGDLVCIFCNTEWNIHDSLSGPPSDSTTIDVGHLKNKPILCISYPEALHQRTTRYKKHVLCLSPDDAAWLIQSLQNELRITHADD